LPAFVDVHTTSALAPDAEAEAETGWSGTAKYNGSALTEPDTLERAIHASIGKQGAAEQFDDKELPASDSDSELARPACKRSRYGRRSGDMRARGEFQSGEGGLEISFCPKSHVGPHVSALLT